MVLVNSPAPLCLRANSTQPYWAASGPPTHQHELLVGGLTGDHVEPQRRSERVRFVGVLAYHFYRRFGNLADDS